MRQLTLLLMTVSLLVGGVPQKISYQGYVTHADGKLVEDGYYDVKFKLYQNLTEGEALWEELQNLYIGSGLISATLGGITALNFSESMHFLEIEIGGEMLTPRQELTTVFYAFHAESAVNAATANLATKATKSDTATYATTSGSAASATKATNADTASYAKTIVGTTAESHSITGSSTSAGTLKLYEDTDDGTNFVSLKAGTMGADVNYILPTADGTSGQFLSTDASGTLSWSTPSGAASIDGLSDASTGGGVGNVILGHTNVTGSGNTAVGDSANYSNPNGDGNTAIGYKALYAGTEGGQNLAIGYMAGYGMKSSNNIAIGNRAIYGSTVESHNIGIGEMSMYSNTSGTENIAIGREVFYSNTSSDGNVALGSKALYSNTTSGMNVAIGYNSLYSNTTANAGGDNYGYNIAIGHKSLYSNTTGTVNTAIGYNALYDNTTGSYNVAVGRALYNNTTANYNTAVGYSALAANTTGTGNTASGSSALSSNTTASYNTAVGRSALNSNTTGKANTASGYAALSDNTTGGWNTAAGHYALSSNTTGNSNAAFGDRALNSNTTGDRNTALGDSALLSNTTANNNTGVGYSALSSNTTGGWNTASGYYALGGNTTGSYNSAYGKNALFSNTTASYNTAVGYQSLYDSERTDDANAYNTAIGYNAGNTGTGDITTGDKNVLVGASTAASAATASNQIVIGYGASGHGNNIAVIGNGSATAIHPHDDNEVDLGSSSYEYKDLYLDGTAYTDGLSVDGSIFKKTTVTTISTAGAVTYTAAQIIGGLILRDTNGGNRTDVSPTAANIVAAIPNAVVGSSFEFHIKNSADGNEEITLSAGTGVTISHTTTTLISQNRSGMFLAVATNVTSGSEAVTIYFISHA